MTRKFIFFLLILCSQQTHAQTLPTDAEIDDLIKVKVTDTTHPLLYRPIISKTLGTWPQQLLVYSDNISANPFSIYGKKETVFLDTILSSEDRNYISLQVNSFKQKLLSIPDINYASLSDSTITYLSVPLFSKNKEYAIIRQLTRCGQNCGSVYVLLYRKVNGIWHYYKYVTGGVF